MAKAILTPVIVMGGGGELEGIIDGSIVNFKMPSKMTEIKPYRFQGFTDLLTVNLDGAKTIGAYVFDGCTEVNEVSNMTGLISIGNYAFRDFGKNGSGFAFIPINKCDVGTYAFRYAGVTKLKGTFDVIGTYAFDSCAKLDEIDITTDGLDTYAFNNGENVTICKAKINGAIGNYAFYNLQKVATCNISGNIEAMGTYAFSRFGSNRPNASTNRITMDLRSSSFSNIGTYAFGGDSSTSSLRNKYMTIYMPSSVKTIETYAFGYTDNCNFYFESEEPPTLATGNCFGNATSFNIFVPYNSVDAYRTKTNWTTHSAVIKGFASENTFALNYNLPAYSVEGFALTWYSDEAMTSVVTKVTDVSIKYYCSVGSERVAYGITKVFTTESVVQITDGVKDYIEGEGVPIGTELTINITPTSGFIPYVVTLNGGGLVSGDTYEMQDDLNILAIYWDGVNVPIDPVFANNSWELIKIAFRENEASSLWSVGDTKSVTLTNGETYTIRIADLTSGRYALSDASGSSNGVLEFVECQTTDRYMNSSNNNSGGWANCYMRNTIMMSTLYNLLPSDLKDAISEVDVLSGTGGSTTSGTSSSANKLFLPSEWEIFGAKTYSIGDSEGAPQYGYYSANNTAAFRIKKNLAGTPKFWWLRSPHSGNSTSFCRVNSNGSVDFYLASSSIGVAPAFAI